MAAFLAFSSFTAFSRSAVAASVAASAAHAALPTDGTEVYTISTSTTVKTTASVMFVSAAVSTLTIAGPASANPGEKITYTLTAKNANGNPIPDAAYAGTMFTKAPSASASLVTMPFGGTATDTVTTTAGVATATMATREISCLGSAGEGIDQSPDQGQGALHEQERDHRPDFR